MALRTLVLSLLVGVTAAGAALAETAPFDLSGPQLQVTVSHAGTTLPVWQVPNLSAGDVLEVRPDFPKGEAAHYLLVLGFLRGATNPPPKDWFHKAETWGKHGQDGIKAVVPAGAEQAIVFLAPATGGDFKTLVSAVRGRPGAFVRAAQALHQAALDRSRLDAYLEAIRRRTPGEPDRLKTVSPLLARSLTMKLNEECLRKTPELQAACLTEGEESLVLDDGHSPSMVETLTTGNTADLALSVSSTPKAGYGYYSPYLAAVMDMGHILDSLHTAQYQYIPALATGHEDELALLLNTAPSFHNPKSVLVTSLPLVEPPQSPAFEAVDPKASYCVDRADLVLPVEGAPLAFSTGYARNLALRVKDRDGRGVDLPARPVAEKGGLMIDTAAAAGLASGVEADGVLVGDWGFEPFEGPHFHLQSAAKGQWSLSPGEAASVIVGRADKAVIQGAAPACVESIALQRTGAPPEPVQWTPEADGVAVTLPLTDAAPGAMTLLVTTYGQKAPQAVPLTAFAQAGRLDGFTLHAGDADGVLRGARLDEVKELRVAGVAFKPGVLTSKDGVDELTLQTDAQDAVGKLTPGQGATAEVGLSDGRKLSLRFKVAPVRPRVALISKSIQLPSPQASIGVDLTSVDELPLDAQLAFSLRAEGPARFTPQSVVEIQTADGSASVTLKPGDGLTLEDPTIAIASLDLAKAFGASAFGGLRVRLVDPAGASDWLPLGTLVRVPVLRALECRSDASAACTLTGSGLFLIDQVSASPTFDDPITIPPGFPGAAISVPAPKGGRLYMKLHDDPQVVNNLRLPQAAPPPSPDAGAPPPKPSAAGADAAKPAAKDQPA